MGFVDVQVEVDAAGPVGERLDAQVVVTVRRHQRRELAVGAAPGRQRVAGDALPERDAALGVAGVAGIAGVAG